jgi:hypothetical protein
MNNSILLTIPLAIAPLLLALIARNALLLALFLALIVVVIMLMSYTSQSCFPASSMITSWSRSVTFTAFFCAASLAIRWRQFGRKETNKVLLHHFDCPTREGKLKEAPQGEFSNVLV